MTIQSVRQYIVAEEEGGTWFATWRKSPTQTTVTGIWYDLGMATGNPAPNYYAATPLRSKALARSTDGGLDHGGGVAPSKKYLKEFGIIGSAGVPITFLLCDYLLYYPFVDMDNTDVVTVEPLSRYADGFGVQIMAIQVFSQSGVGSPKFQVQYTNSDGVAGRLTELVSCNTLTIPGNVITTHAVQPAGYCHSASPFIPLQRGDRGVRSIQSVIWQTPDVGLVALVLVKPLEMTLLREITAPVERNCLADFNKMPEIQDDAYLNLLCCPSGSISGAQFHGYLKTIWG
jgi:hypothetical protein